MSHYFFEVMINWPFCFHYPLESQKRNIVHHSIMNKFKMFLVSSIFRYFLNVTIDKINTFCS